MKHLRVEFDTNVPSPAAGRGGENYLTCADVREGFDIDEEGGFFYIRHPKLDGWQERFAKVPANRVRGAICVVEEQAKGKK